MRDMIFIAATIGFFLIAIGYVRACDGRSIVVLAKEKYGLRRRDLASLEATFVPFTASRVNVLELNIDLDSRKPIKR